MPVAFSDLLNFLANHGVITDDMLELGDAFEVKSNGWERRAVLGITGGPSGARQAGESPAKLGEPGDAFVAKGIGWERRAVLGITGGPSGARQAGESPAKFREKGDR